MSHARILHNLKLGRLSLIASTLIWLPIIAFYLHLGMPAWAWIGATLIMVISGVFAIRAHNKVREYDTGITPQEETHYGC